ncbi:MAG: amino acid ABC transporter permease [Anaerolineaceae bacterium]|nr:amino acid ABC transporter permease [Anaerolineaceae bacterium]
MSQSLTQPGWKEKKKFYFDRWWLLLVAVIALILLLVFTTPDPYKRIVLYVRAGIWTTVSLTLISFVLVLFVGLLIALMRISKSKILRGISTVFVEIIRGIPLMVQLIFWYFAFPSVIQGIGDSLQIASLSDFKTNAIAMAILGLTICYSAYMSEVIRAGIQSISKGQMEAARSLGMTYFQAMRYVVLPQAIRVILPPVGNEFITLLKDSSLVSVVAVADLTRRGREFMAANFQPIQTWAMVALLYLVLTLLAGRVVAWLERRFHLEK